MSGERGFPTAEEAAAACAQHLVDRLDAVLSGAPRAALAVSGGSTPRLMFDAMAKLSIDWKRVHLFSVDERCVPPDDALSNYRMTREHLLDRIHIPAENVHRIRGEVEPENAAREYALSIERFFGSTPQFDLVQLGMGADGHTASLFPGSPLIGDREGVARAVYAESMRQWRVTLLPGVLLAAREAVFLVSGLDKAETLRQVRTGPLDPSRLPAQIVARAHPNVAWFVDEAAVGRLA
jgi:6-phosphogluconolactonase